jgi:hypothetical protein
MRLTERHHRAAALVAADDLTDEDIAAQAGITRRQLTAWKQHPDFDALVQHHLDVFRRRVESRGIASRHRRVASQDERWRKLQQVIAERASDAAWADVPGWTTGLLVHQTKQIGSGANAQVVDEFAVDTGLLREMRELEKHAATELGQWSEKHDHTVSVQLRQEIERIATTLGLDPDEVLVEADAILKAHP